MREPLVLKSELQYGDNVIFEIALTDESDEAEESAVSLISSLGLSFNTTTGVLEGTPSEKLANTSFTITAKNPIGQASAPFGIEIKDHFSVILPVEFTTPESYKLHMSGQGNQSTACRITAIKLKAPIKTSKTFCATWKPEKWISFS